MLRRIIIRASHGGVLLENYYNGDVVKDSQALHYALCEIDPGDNYTVQFAGPKDSGNENGGRENGGRENGNG